MRVRRINLERTVTQGRGTTKGREKEYKGVGGERVTIKLPRPPLPHLLHQQLSTPSERPSSSS